MIKLNDPTNEVLINVPEKRLEKDGTTLRLKVRTGDIVKALIAQKIETINALGDYNISFKVRVVKTN